MKLLQTSDDRKFVAVVLSVYIYLVISYGGAGDVVTTSELVEVLTRVNTEVNLGQNLGSGLHAALQESSRIYITFGWIFMSVGKRGMLGNKLSLSLGFPK